MDQEETYDFREPNERITDMVASTQANDVAAFMSDLREATEFELDSRMVWAMIAVFLIRAMAEFIRRSTDGARPIIEVAAEKWRESGEDDGKDPYREH